MVTRWWSEKSPGLRILWVWTFGTAAVLITNVVRTRLHDMEKMLKEEEVAVRPEPSIVDDPAVQVLKED